MKQEASKFSQLEVWPFLISRNQTLDYRPILVPDFLKENSTIIQRAAKLDHHSNSMRSIEVCDDKYGSLIFSYRSITAERNDEVLLDASSRQIYRIEGFVFRGNQLDQEEIDEILGNDKLFSQAKLEIDKAFENFWNQKAPNMARLSESIRSDIGCSKTEPVVAPVVPIEIITKAGFGESDQVSALSKTRLVAALVLVSIIMLWFSVDNKIKLIGAENVKIDDQDLDYVSETFFGKAGSGGISQDFKSSRIITLNTCAEKKCPYALVIFPASKKDNQSLAPLNISDTAKLIHAQLIQTDNLKNYLDKSEPINLGYQDVESNRNAFKDMNILYAVVHKFDQAKSGQEGKWRLEFHDIRNKKIFKVDAETTPIDNLNEVKQSLKSTSNAMASRLQIDI